MNIIETLKKVDRKVPLPVFSTIKRVWQAYNRNRLLNIVRRRRDYIRGYVVSRFWKEPKRLHLGCGHHAQSSAVNIDYIRTGATDYVLDASNLPFPENSVRQIETYHMIEHIPRPILEDMLSEWHEMLSSGGKLVMELPDFDGVVTEYLETNDPERAEILLKYVFGSQRFQSDIHYWGWNYERLARTLREIGYVDIEERPAEDYHTEEAPCLRLEAKVSYDK